MFRTYNGLTYNASEYNGLFDSISQALSLSLSEVISLATDLPKSDAVFLTDQRSTSISNKGLVDTLELDAWLQIRRSPAQSDWTN